MNYYFCNCGTERGAADALITLMPVPVRGNAPGIVRGVRDEHALVEIHPGFQKVETLEGAATPPEAVQLRACRQCAVVYAFVPPVSSPT